MNTLATAPANLRRNNGTIQLRSKATGVIKTIKVEKQPLSAKFMAGKRLVSLQSESGKFETIGVMFGPGSHRICLWKKFRDSNLHHWLKRILENPGAYSDRVDVDWLVVE